MLPESPISLQIPGPYYAALFEAMPGFAVLLQNDAPRFTILAVTPAYLQQFGYTKETIIGKGIFEAFPANNTSLGYLGAGDLLASFNHVLSFKVPHFLPVQRYDLKNEDGSFTERHWRASNRPVFDAEGMVGYILHTAEDITEEVQRGTMQERIKGMEQAYSLVMQTPIPVCVLKGPELIVELANEPTLRLWGRTKDVIGLPLEEAIPEVKGQGYIEIIHEVRESGKASQVYENPVTLIRNGKQEVAYINYIYQPYYEEDPSRAVGVLAVGNDVTDKVLARKKDIESEAKYQTLFESLDQGLCVVELLYDKEGRPFDHRMVEGNSAFENLRPVIDHNLLNQYHNVAVSGDSIRYIHESTPPGKWYDVYVFKIGSQDARTVALLFTDITEAQKAEEAIKRSEHNLRNMILQSPIAMAILKGPSFVVEIANDRMYELWGRERSEMLNKSIFVALPEVKDQGYEELLTGVYTTGKSFSALGIPVTLPRSKGIETVYINLLYEAFREGDGTISGIMAVAIDVTEQLLAKQKIEEVVAQRTKELALANEDLTRSNKNLEEFAYAASHDLKEPVRKIQIFSHHLTELLQGKLGDVEWSYFARISKSVDRMNALINDLLMYSHVSRGIELKDVVDLNLKLKRVQEDLELEIEEKQATISVGVLPTIKGNIRQLQQLFHNLIGNALKYSIPGVAPVVQITCHQAGDDDAVPVKTLKPLDQYFLIQVRDNGIGFDQADAERIFNVFTRLHSNADYQGTGVGLAIVRKVVEAHQGYIWAESREGEGARFNVLLPMQ